MLAHPTQERLLALGLTGMARALEDQRRSPDSAALSFEERLALLLDRETIERENKRLVARLRFAALRQEAVVEDIDLRAARGLDRALFQKLAAGDWISRKQNLLIIGPAGVGKSWLACALGHKACRDDRSVAYHRVPRLLEALALARGDGRYGRYGRLLKALGRVQLLILDDWGLAPLSGEQRRDLLEIMDDRHGRGSTVVTSQVPVDHWHEVIGDPTSADAVLDRLVHNAHRLTLKGESLRKPAAQASMLDAESLGLAHDHADADRDRDHRNPCPAWIGISVRVQSERLSHIGGICTHVTSRPAAPAAASSRAVTSPVRASMPVITPALPL